MNPRSLKLLLALATVALTASPARAAIRAAGLRCEYRVDPLGVDVRRPRLSWLLESKERGQRQSAYQVVVASSPEELKRDHGDLWDSGRVSSDESIQIEYAGRALRSTEPCFWKVRVWDRDGKGSGWSRPASWTVGLLDRADWKGQWIGCEIPRDRVENATYLPSPYLRKPFETSRPVRRALLFATAAGLYEMYLDGKRVGQDYFTPGWTEYHKRLYYQNYDVTPDLKRRGEHVLGAALGDGWYGLHHNGRGRLSLLAQLQIEYADGSRELVTTDRSWKATFDGPVRSDDIYNGESYDARREMPGWSSVGFDDSKWRPVRVGLVEQEGTGFVDVTEKVRQAVTGETLSIPVSNEQFGDPAFNYVKTLTVEFEQGGRRRRQTAREGDRLRIAANGELRILRASYGAEIVSAQIKDAAIQAHPGNPVRKTEELRPAALTEPKPGVYVFNMGQNFSGWVRLKARGTAGQKVTLRFAEMLNPDGTIYVTNLRGAKCTDTYVCRGGAAEVWEPRFTFHGFQYVELTGVSEKPSLDTLTGVVLHSDMPRTGDFTCSDPLLNKLFQNVVWGQRSNYLEVPTDCPQRDERMGWSGDAQVFIRTGAYNMDVAAFFTAWLNTFNDSQTPDGGYPNVSPRHYGVSPAWGDAGIICPWTLYQMYGDKRVIRDHWDHMVRWIDYLKQRSTNLVRPAEGFGDWLNVKAEMPKDVIATAYFARSTQLLAEMAEVIGRSEDAAKYRKLAADIRAAFDRAFVQPDGRIKGDTQTTYLMALGFDLLPEAKRAAAARRLVELIAERNDHLSTGFLGVNLLLPELEDIRRPDLAWKLLTNRTYPSWLYSVTQGATTIWERWDGWTQDRGFQDPGMNSFNHYAYGSCGEWMFSSAAGIDSDGPAFHRLRIRPVPSDKVSHVQAHYDSIRGRIATEWTNGTDGFHLTLTVPANTTATVYIPASGQDAVMEGTGPAARAEGVKFVRMEDGRAVYEVGSGTYRFHAR